MENYAAFFEFHGIQIGQILLTQDGMMEDPRRGPMKDTIAALWHHHVIPIINENDSVATEEIKFGDNDHLSVQVAQLVEADLLVILTDIDGLFTANPMENPQATLVESLDGIDDTVLSWAQDKANGKSRGGMRSKLLASKRASDSGIDVILANGRRPENLPVLLSGHGIGTRIAGRKDTL
jgi:glutamate 5-kinase